MTTSPLGFFSVDQAAELTDLRPELIRRWDNDHVFTPAFAAENRRRPFSRLYSFDDVVTLRTLAHAKEYGVQGRDLRRIAEFIEHHPETNWSDTAIYVVGRKVYFKYVDANRALHVVTTSPLGQQAMPKILTIDLADVRSESEARVRRLAQRSADQLGSVHRDRYIMSGAEVFAGTRVPVETIVDLIEMGWDEAKILENYPRLTSADVAVARERASTTTPQLVS